MTDTECVSSGEGLQNSLYMSVPGNGWENQALFDYDSLVLPAISLFNQL